MFNLVSVGYYPRYLEFWLWPNNRLHTCKIKLKFVKIYRKLLRTHSIFLPNFFRFLFKNCKINYFRCSSIHLAVKRCLIYEPSFIFLILWPLVSKEHYTYAIILMWHNEGLKLLWNRNLGIPFGDIFSLYRRLKVWWHLLRLLAIWKKLWPQCLRDVFAYKWREKSQPYIIVVMNQKHSFITVKDGNRG